MIEKPMLFTGAMVRAYFAGVKTETRRIIKPQPPFGCDYAINGAMNSACCFKPGADGTIEAWVPPTGKSVNHLLPCPHPLGSVIYGKETHYWDRFEKIPKTKPDDFPLDFYYRADGECCQQIPECQCGSEGKPKWRPSIFMPRWAARMLLEVTRVHVERLHDISDDDAEADGADFWFNEQNPDHPEPPASSCAYKLLWESINGKGSWALNPFVWVYQFPKFKP